jgi:hypothetical protein
VVYIWRKQLEEADIIVVSKIDLLTPDALKELTGRIEVEFPEKRLLSVSVRTGAGLQEWFELLKHSKPALLGAMEIDYDTYAAGEALLGWLNATIRVDLTEPMDSAVLLQTMARTMQGSLGEAEIAHLKMTFSPDDSLAGEIAALSVVRSGVVPELTLRLEEPVTAGELIVNCRAEAAPEALRVALESGIAELKTAPNGQFKLEHVEQFRPGRPNPTHRLATPEGEFVTA